MDEDNKQICSICNNIISSGNWHIGEDGKINYYCSSNCDKKKKG